ncbi:MAG: type II secretion system protein [Chthonomonadales bacterium]|nr:type II secretion system protein [Chthonomonadales bacterium]
MQRSRAFTLIEVLLVVAIIGVLAGLILALLEPVRERSREAVCTSNLRQIGQAYAMYAADYDGAEPTVGVRAHHDDLGMPSDEQNSNLFETYVNSRDVLFCPSYHGSYPRDRLFISYVGYSVGGERFADGVAARGPALPLRRCESHNAASEPIDALRHAPRWEIFRFNILRLGGSVDMVRVHGQDYRPWDW